MDPESPGGLLDDRRPLCGTKCSQVQHPVFGDRYCRPSSRFGTTLFPLEISPTLRQTFPRSTRAAGSGGALWKLNSIGPSRRLIFCFAKLYQSAETLGSRCI